MKLLAKKCFRWRIDFIGELSKMAILMINRQESKEEFQEMTTEVKTQTLPPSPRTASGRNRAAPPAVVGQVFAYPKKTRKKRKKRNRVLDYLFFLFVRVASMVIQLPEVDRSLAVASWLGKGFYRHYSRGRLRALENLRLSYPEKSAAWIEAVAQRSFKHIVMVVFDVFWTARLVRPSSWPHFFEMDPREVQPVYDLANDHKGLIMVTGHYGSFEALGCAMGASGITNYSIGRPIDNPFLDRYLRQVRQSQSQIIIDKKGASGQMVDILSSGKILAFVADQNGKRKDVFVDFFGRKAATYKSIGLLAMTYNVPIVVGYCRRKEDRFQFQIGVNRIIRPQDWQHQDDPLHWITQQYTSAIEAFVREDPGQYWWMHRRWKTRPPHERQAEAPSTPA